MKTRTIARAACLLIVLAACRNGGGDEGKATSDAATTKGGGDAKVVVPKGPSQAEIDWLFGVYQIFVFDPCAGIVQLRRNHTKLTAAVLAELYAAKNVALKARDDWQIARAQVVGAGGPDVGSNASSVPLFATLADFVAAAPGGDPVYPETFASRAEAIVRGTIGIEELFAALASFPEYAPWIAMVKGQVDGFRAQGVPEPLVREAFVSSFRPVVGIDACLALPRSSFDALYPA